MRARIAVRGFLVEEDRSGEEGLEKYSVSYDGETERREVSGENMIVVALLCF